MIKKFLLISYRFKPLSFGKKNNSGRNILGKIVVRHKGGCSKRNFVFIDFNRRNFTQWALCVNLTFDPNRSAFVALLKYSNGVYSYILAPQGLFYGSFIRTCQHNSVYHDKYFIGYCVFLIKIPIHAVFFNLEVSPNKGSQYARSAGTYCRILRQDKEKLLHFVKLPTNKLIIISSYCLVTLGKCSNPLHYKEIVTKSGLNRNIGIRPTVRGVAMNPVDHPHGGRTKTSSPEVTPWGKIAKKTR